MKKGTETQIPLFFAVRALTDAAEHRQHKREAMLYERAQCFFEALEVSREGLVPRHPLKLARASSEKRNRLDREELDDGTYGLLF